ncbi:AraC family transcriptional regulator [Flavilitoribacter nigricans]|uniref:AraC family transcriptional regulator n=1 Tax=Flavilitoribacter nigricans (strain ATCC 23147 / DSM 23189 / NBRC 102662 / NCIMB 1420 / SS-2) TaxID=1122177 RepID=A0A2D0N4K0_FLAN2|nr:AraC family transcriptional regulator [Flavilitoribacter nigricans]PHN03434.1 AraC family transcriptional regulator [Flavilitoribacter nigricans DSM 23189 = NBRC 102662]
MKIMHEKVMFPGHATIRVKWSSFPHVIYPLHFHGENELMFIHQSYGTRFIADSIEEFNAGDFVLLGSHIPHFWDFNEIFKTTERPYQVKATVIHFPENFFRDQVDEYPELAAIKQLLVQARKGISFGMATAKKLEEKVLALHGRPGFEQLILLLEILQQLAKSDDYKLLASEGYQPEYQDFREERLSKVINYLNYRYKEKISLEEVAEVASLHPTAFCRFFKEKTSRTLMEFIIEMRIGYACKLLTNSSMSVSQICYECGFNNLANFNRKFKSLTKYTPSQYQQHYLDYT